MNVIRPLLILFVIAFAVAFSGRHTQHHSGPNAFETLYMHLVPSKLVVSDGATLSRPHSEAGDAEHAQAGEAEHGAEAGHDEGAEHADHAPREHLFSLSLPAFLSAFDMHPEGEGAWLVMTNLQVFQIAAAILVLLCFMGVPRYLRTGKGDYLSRLFAGWTMWIRDEMVYPVMGKDLGRQFLPFFLVLFFFILFMNMLGLVPGAATATASIFVTGAMATITLGAMLICGMVVQGPVAYWKNLVPEVPAALWPLMFLVELIGVFIKPFALMIRLFANMSGGHLVVLSLMGLIFTVGAMGPAIGWASAPVSVGFAVFIMIIEFFVAMLQAYIFTMLSIMFVHASVHPEH